MKFALRYYRTLLAGAFRLTRVFMTVSYIYFTASIVISLVKYGFDSSIIFDIVMLFVPVVVVIIAAAVLEIRSYPYLRTLNSCGYCAETLEQFLKIQKGRPMNYKTTLQYTGLLHGMDRTEEAWKLLCGMEIPEKDVINRVGRFYQLELCAIKMERRDLTDNIWSSNSALIDKCRAGGQDTCRILLLMLTMIYADCFAGRFERALEQLDGFLGGKLPADIDNLLPEFHVIRVYILNALGRKEEVLREEEQTRRMIASRTFVFDFERQRCGNDLDRAAAGILPV